MGVDIPNATITHRGFVRAAWAVVTYNIGVILWGAWVRITGSGAGCGEHWPTCNGEVIPRTEDVATLIEFTHRVTSGMTLPLAMILVIWARRIWPRGHRIRWATWGVVFFLLVEAFIGAVLVRWGLVAEDDSVARAVIIAVHLVNTFSLVALGGLVAWWGAGGGPMRWPRSGRMRWGLLAAVLAVILTAMTGAITALGDTLFPVSPDATGDLFAQLGEGLDPSTHFLIRLRAIHPLVAILTAAGLIGVGVTVQRHHASQETERWGSALTTLVLLQVFVGVVSIIMHAPGWLQLLHLLVANLLWLTLVLLIAAWCATDPIGKTPDGRGVPPP